MPTPSPAVRQLAADIIDRWTKGETPDTRTALARYPELAKDKAAVLDLAFAEYWLRQHAGERVELEAYCRKFPEYHVSLGRLLAQQSLQEKPEAAAPEVPIQATIEMPGLPANEAADRLRTLSSVQAAIEIPAVPPTDADESMDYWRSYSRTNTGGGCPGLDAYRCRATHRQTANGPVWTYPGSGAFHGG